MLSKKVSSTFLHGSNAFGYEVGAMRNVALEAKYPRYKRVQVDEVDIAIQSSKLRPCLSAQTPSL